MSVERGKWCQVIIESIAKYVCVKKFILKISFSLSKYIVIANSGLHLQLYLFCTAFHITRKPTFLNSRIKFSILILPMHKIFRPFLSHGNCLKYLTFSLMLIQISQDPKYLIPLIEISVEVQSQLEENTLRISSHIIGSQNILNYLKYSCI